ncbi:MAG TPA: hypothetical protein VJ803_05575 [Gemmatimonadaceae bacterium]|nr:hypothetical protein [Gemmatimonadaceae bacterium]
MYRTCVYCNRRLGANDLIREFPVGRRLAFDAQRGRLWVVCASCGRWNLTPFEERWEAIEECERLFRGTLLRISSDNIGLAQLKDGMELVRIGRALRPEIASWRYGRYARRLVRARNGRSAGINGVLARGAKTIDSALRWFPHVRLPYDAATWLRIHSNSSAIVAMLNDDRDMPIIVRRGHLESARLMRPDPDQPWMLELRHDAGTASVSGDPGVRTAGKLLAAVNGFTGTSDEVEYAIAKLEDAGNPEGYFTRIAALVMRTAWGRVEGPGRAGRNDAESMTAVERLAMYVTTRSFWARGGTGSESSTTLPQLPIVDRLALEMAASEDVERRAMEGELAELEAAWREAEEIAAIADGLLPMVATDVSTSWWRRLTAPPEPA